MMTTTGPLELSGFAAGVSVEGPMASVSVRFRLVGGVGFAAAVVGSVDCTISCGNAGCAGAAVSDDAIAGVSVV